MLRQKFFGGQAHLFRYKIEGLTLYFSSPAKAEESPGGNSDTASENCLFDNAVFKEIF